MKKIIAALIVLSVSAGCTGDRDIQKQTRFLMDTYITIQVPGGKEVRPAISKAFDRMKEVEAKFNVLNTESQVNRFNTKGEPITDPEIIKVLKTAVKVSMKSKGSFDITMYPVSTLWGFYSEKPKVPSGKKINEFLKFTGYRNLVIKKGKVEKKLQSVQIDLGGIAKGYAIFEAIKELKKQGVDSALVDAGGDIFASGKFEDRPWIIGIRNPRGEGVIGSIETHF